MAGLPPGDPQLVSMIVNHLKTQGLFDQFRRDCLADVDTKPAYLNLKQRVDNFVSNHLSNHTWSPHLNKNQLRNNIRQLVLQSGMLEQGVDRIVAQVVDPKINHIFRPQVERVVREFLSPGSCSQEPPAPLPPPEIKPDSSIPEQAPLSTPATTTASDAMSILDTITSLNQEASVRASSATEKGPKGQAPDDLVQLVEENMQDMNIVDEGDDSQDVKSAEEAEEAQVTAEDLAPEVKTENTQEEMELDKEGSMEGIKMEEEESGAQEQTEEEKDKRTSKISGKPSEEKQDDDDGLKSTNQAKQRAERERIKEEYSLEDSDLEGLSDITVSSVHTSDLSSFEEESDEEEQPSDSSEEGELPPDDESERAEKKHSADTGDEDKESKPRRKAYVHKPFLYSRYYSDSDDEITVEERRRSAAKEKEERLLKRQQNRERMEEKRKQKAAQAEEQDQKQKSADSGALECPKAKEARKERKVLEKKMALNRKRKLDSRKGGEVSSKKKGYTGDMTKRAEIKSFTSKTPQPKLMRNLSESASSDEKHRRMSGSISEDSSDTKKLADKSRTHSFILDLEQGSQEALKQRSIGKFDRLSRKELHSKERKDKERSLSDERTKLKQKQEKKSEHQSDESQMKEGTAVKVSAEEKGEKKPKVKGERKMSASTREGKVAEAVPEEGGSKDAKKAKVVSGESVKAEKEKDKSREKDKMKEKEKGKAEKSSVKSDFKQLLRPDSAGSSEDRSDMEPGSDSTKKREKHPKDVLKRSKSHSEERPGDKPKSKTDSEKEKAKPDQDSQKLQKSSSETDKDPKRVKTTEKGKIPEKPKVKSKEEAKIPLALKTDKKVQSSDVRGAGGAGVAKPEAAKEKRKDGNAKEQRRGAGEGSHEKSDLKSSKKKLEKKEKVSEKKDNSQDEKTISEEKLEKSDKSAISPPVSLSLETEEPRKKQPLLQETSTDSDPVTTTVATSFSDDTCDALSDITPEPAEDETESRLGEVPAVPAENDALMTLMDVCTSAEARLSPERLREEATAKAELQDADMKMKEAALTLLSMDPDSTVSSSLICPDPRDEALLYHLHTEQEDAAVPEEETPPAGQVQTVHESQLSPSETSPAACLQTAELADEKPDTAEESGNLGKTETTETETETEVAALMIKEDDTTSKTCQIYSKEEDTNSVETSLDTQLDEKVAAPSDQEVPGADKTDLEEASGSTLAVSDTAKQVSEIPSKPEQTEPDNEVIKTNFGEVGAEEEENQTKMVVDEGEAESKNADGNVPAEEADVQTMETDIPNTSGEVEAESQSKLVKQASNVSSTDSQEDEKSSDLSEKEEKKDGRVRRKRKLSSQKADDVDEKEGKEQLSVEDNVEEVRATRRGRSSRTTEEAEKEQPGKSEEPPSRRGRRSGAAAKETAADNPKCDENRAEDIPVETSSLEAFEKEDKGEDESKPAQIVQSGDEDNQPSPALEDKQGAGSSDIKEMEDTSEPAMKRKRSEEVEESSEETQAQEEMKDNEQQEQITEHPENDSGCSPPSQSEDVEEEVCRTNKPDAAEEQQEDQDVAPKKPARRGRPPKAAATEESDKKEKKADEKDNEPNDEEEEEEEKEGDEKETATRATTRLASRLEAEKNKPSKPSTRASRQNGKEETAAGTRGTRGQAASKGGRKREASPPAVRTRGGQKSEELPSKRAKR